MNVEIVMHKKFSSNLGVTLAVWVRSPTGRITVPEVKKNPRLPILPKAQVYDIGPLTG